jgi:hypothetical protein
VEWQADANWMDPRLLRGTVLQATESGDDGTTGGLLAIRTGTGSEEDTAMTCCAEASL